MRVLLFLLISLLHFQSIALACSNTCGGDSPVKIDLKSQCMCVGTQCFSVGIARDLSGNNHFDPMRSWNGTGVLGVARGTKFQTKTGGGTTSYDNDALSSGTPNDTDGGKWIHKTGNCAGPSYRTKGCVAVPCEHWPLVKSQMGKAVTYCGGKGPNTVYNSTGSKTVNQSGLHPRYNNQFTGLNVAENDKDLDEVEPDVSQFKEEANYENRGLFDFLRLLFNELSKIPLHENDKAVE